MSNIIDFRLGALALLQLRILAEHDIRPGAIIKLPKGHYQIVKILPLAIEGTRSGAWCDGTPTCECDECRDAAVLNDDYERALGRGFRAGITRQWEQSTIP